MEANINAIFHRSKKEYKPKLFLETIAGGELKLVWARLRLHWQSKAHPLGGQARRWRSLHTSTPRPGRWKRKRQQPIGGPDAGELRPHGPTVRRRRQVSGSEVAGCGVGTCASPVRAPLDSRSNPSESRPLDCYARLAASPPLAGPAFYAHAPRPPEDVASFTFRCSTFLHL